MTIKEEFKSELESLHKSLIEVNDWMYENPELAFEEFETSRYLVNYIKKYDPEVSHPTHGLDTAFEVTFGKDGPLVAVSYTHLTLPTILRV